MHCFTLQVFELGLNIQLHTGPLEIGTHIQVDARALVGSSRIVGNLLLQGGIQKRIVDGFPAALDWTFSCSCWNPTVHIGNNLGVLRQRDLKDWIITYLTHTEDWTFVVACKSMRLVHHVCIFDSQGQFATQALGKVFVLLFRGFQQERILVVTRDLFLLTVPTL
jgi:hypothetical protein